MRARARLLIASNIVYLYIYTNIYAHTNIHAYKYIIYIYESQCIFLYI